MSDDQHSDWRIQAAAEYGARRSLLIEDRSQCVHKRAELDVQIALITARIKEIDEVFKVLELPLEEDDGDPSDTPADAAQGDISPPPAPRSGRMFKDVALELLRAAHPKPLRAAEIQAGVEAEIGRQFHEKTAGMTLYRLLKEGLVRRNGWDWFSADPHDVPPQNMLLKYGDAGMT